MRDTTEQPVGVAEPPPGVPARRAATRLDAVLVALVAAAAVLVAPVTGVTVHDNGGMYLQQAAAITRGQDPGLTFEGRSARGPVFPALLSLSFALGSRSVFTAMTVVRLSFVVAIVLAYVIGRQLYDPRTGLLAAALAWSSYGVNVVAGFLDTDIVLPAVLLMFLVAYAAMVQRASTALAVVAGLLLAFSALLKESAIVYVALPAVAAALGVDHGPRRLRRAAFLYGAFAAVVLPWAAAVTVRYGTPWAAAGVMNPGIQQRLAAANGFDTSAAYWLHQLTLGAPASLFDYFQLQLSRVTPLAGLAAAAWIVLVVDVWRRRRTVGPGRALNDRLLVLAGLAFLPVILPDGALPGRIGQTSIFFFLSYVAIAAVTVRALDKAIGLLPLRRARFAAAAACAAMVIAGSAVQLGAAAADGASTLQLWREGHAGAHPASVFAGPGFKVAGRFTAEHEAAAAWLQARGARRVMADGYSGEGIAFFLDTDGVSLLQPLTTISLWQESAIEAPAAHKPIFTFTYSGFRRGTAWMDLYTVSQDAIVAQLQQSRAEYVVLSGRGQFLASYFDEAPWAERVFRESSVFVYSLRSDRPVEPFAFAPGAPTLHYRTGDGTRGQVKLTDTYTRFDIPGQHEREPDNIFFFLDRPGAALIDGVVFGAVAGDGTVRNLLDVKDSDFEQPGHAWAASGTHTVERVDGGATGGGYALRIAASEPGGSTSLVSLTTPNFPYRSGPNVMTFHGRADLRGGGMCVNDSLAADLTWLRDADRGAYERLLRVLPAAGLTLDAVMHADCVVPGTSTP